MHVFKFVFSVDNLIHKMIDNNIFIVIVCILSFGKWLLIWHMPTKSEVSWITQCPNINQNPDGTSLDRLISG